MPIFSSNRVYGAGVGNTIVAAEGYTENDFGRIMSECATNDMLLFNAAIARDFKEAQAMTEGTMVASELQALREFSVKEAWKGLVAKMKKLWAKIKGVFKAVYAKLSLWLNRNTKLYIAQHRKYLLNKPNLGECPCPKYLNPSKSFMNSLKKSFSEKDAEALKNATSVEDIIKEINAEMKISKKEYERAMKEMNDAEVVTASDVYEKMEKECFAAANDKLTFKNTVYGGSVEKLFEALSGNSKYLKTLKELSKDADKLFKNIINKLNKAAANSEKDTAENRAYTVASKAVSIMQSTINACTSAGIKIVKKAISNDRGLIATLVAYNGPKTESALLEFAYAAGFDTLHEETDGETMEDIEAAAEEEGINIDITVSGDTDADITVNDNTDDDDDE